MRPEWVLALGGHEGSVYPHRSHLDRAVVRRTAFETETDGNTT